MHKTRGGRKQNARACVRTYVDDLSEQAADGPARDEGGGEEADGEGEGDGEGGDEELEDDVGDRGAPTPRGPVCFFFRLKREG